MRYCNLNWYRHPWTFENHKHFIVLDTGSINLHTSEDVKLLNRRSTWYGRRHISMLIDSSVTPPYYNSRSAATVCVTHMCTHCAVHTPLLTSRVCLHRIR